MLLSGAVGTWLALLALIRQTNWHQPRESEIGKLLVRADFSDVPVYARGIYFDENQDIAS
jgi:hypothetical protein